jgi:hypothetical protein
MSRVSVGDKYYEVPRQWNGFVKRNASQISYKDGVCKDTNLFVFGVHTIFKKIYHYHSCEMDMVPNYCLTDCKITYEGQ